MCIPSIDSVLQFYVFKIISHTITFPIIRQSLTYTFIYSERTRHNKVIIKCSINFWTEYQYIAFDIIKTHRTNVDNGIYTYDHLFWNT